MSLPSRKKWRISDADFHKILLPSIINWAPHRQQALYDIIVKGERQVSVAQRLNISRMAVNNMVKEAYMLYSSTLLNQIKKTI